MLHIGDEKTVHYVANVVTGAGILARVGLLVVSAMVLSILLGFWSAML